MEPDAVNFIDELLSTVDGALADQLDILRNDRNNVAPAVLNLLTRQLKTIESMRRVLRETCWRCGTVPRAGICGDTYCACSFACSYID